MRHNAANPSAIHPHVLMFIQTEATPNPATIKFLPGRAVMGDAPPQDFPSAAAAARVPLAAALFAVAGVGSVFFGKDFVAVSKTDGDIAWDDIKPQVLGVMTDFFASGAEPFPAEAVAPPPADGAEAGGETEDATVRQIKEVLETHVRPAVAQDGGDIVFARFENGVVWLTMRGACAGCPASLVTLKQGVEHLLQHYIPAVQEVRATEQGSGEAI